MARWLVIPAVLLGAAGLAWWLLEPADGSDPARESQARTEAEGSAPTLLLGAPRAKPPAAPAASPPSPESPAPGETAGLRIGIRLDGKPALPGNQRVYVDDRLLAPNELAEDPAHGAIHVAPGAAGGPGASIRVEARGYLAPGPRTPAPAAGSPSLRHVTFDLESGGHLVVEGAMAPDGLSQIVLQTLRGDAWDSFSTSNWYAATFPEAMPEFIGLPAGRYRVVDLLSRIRSDPVDVRPGAAATAHMDLSEAVSYGGRVEGPPGEDLALARVFVFDRRDEEPTTLGSPVASPSTRGRFGAVDADGSFQLRGRRSERVRLGVAHPHLRPAMADGTCEVVVGLGEAHLRLEAGPEIRFRQDAPVGGIQLPVRAHLRSAADPTLTRVVWCAPTSDGVRRCGVPRPGRWQVLLDPRDGSAPLERTIDVEAGASDLGLLAFPRGSTLRVRLGGAHAPACALRVEAGGASAYVRTGLPTDDRRGVIPVTGLGPGEHRLFVDRLPRGPVISWRADGRPEGSGVLAERTVRVDGVHDVDLEVDLPP